VPRLREGLGATYVGHEASLTGHRVHVLQDEGSYAHVRWLSGERIGGIELVATAKLAFDRYTSAPSPFDVEDDEFGFEEPIVHVGVDCRSVYDRGGIQALARSLDEGSYLANLRTAVRAGLTELKGSLSSSATLVEVASDLGDEGVAVVGALVNQLILEAIAGDDHG
jgi:hypothetical protein